MTWLRHIARHRLWVVGLLLAALSSVASASSLLTTRVHINTPIPVDQIHENTFVSIVINRATGDYAWGITNGKFMDGTPKYHGAGQPPPMVRVDGKWVPLPQYAMIGSQDHALVLRAALPNTNHESQTLAGGVHGTSGNLDATPQIRRISGTNRDLVAIYRMGIENFNGSDYDRIVALESWVDAYNRRTGQQIELFDGKGPLWMRMRDLNFPPEDPPTLGPEFDELVRQRLERETRGTPSAMTARLARGWATARGFAKMEIGRGPMVALVGGMAAGLVGYALGGEYGAMGAGFVYSTGIGWWMSAGQMSLGMSALQGVAGLVFGVAIDRALVAMGCTNGFVRTAVNIGAGSLVAGAFATAGTVGTTMVTSAFLGALAAAGMFHAGQWGELIQANRAALAGDPEMIRTINEITLGGTWSAWNPITYLAHGGAHYMRALNPF